MGQTSGASRPDARVGSRTKRKSKTRGDENGGQASRGARGGATGSAAAFTPSPTRVLSVVGAASATGRPLTSRPAARGASQLSADLLRREPIPRKLRETPMRPGAVETKRVATAREATAKPAMVFGRNSGGGGGEAGFDERVRLAAAGATAHSRILLETGKRPAVLRASLARWTRPKMPLRVLPRERVAARTAPAPRRVRHSEDVRAGASARKQAFGYSFASSTNAAAGDRTASVIAPSAPRTATLAEKMCGARMNATATRLNAGRGTTTSSKNHSAHPPRGFWRTDVTRAEDPGFNVSARPMSPTVERAARPATARVNVRGDGAQAAHVFGAKMHPGPAHTHDAAAHGGCVARGDVDIENVPLAAGNGRGPGGGDGPSAGKRPSAKITRPRTEYEENPGKRDAHESTRRCLNSVGREPERDGDDWRQKCIGRRCRSDWIIQLNEGWLINGLMTPCGCADRRELNSDRLVAFHPPPPRFSRRLPPPSPTARPSFPHDAS